MGSRELNKANIQENLSIFSKSPTILLCWDSQRIQVEVEHYIYDLLVHSLAIYAKYECRYGSSLQYQVVFLLTDPHHQC